MYPYKGIFLTILLPFYTLIPPLLHSFTELRITILLVTSILFLAYCFFRYYVLSHFWYDRKKAFRHLLLNNGALLIGLIILYTFEGFVYIKDSTLIIPSYRFFVFIFSGLFLIPTLYTNYIIDKTRNKQ